MTLIESALFRKIEARECLGQGWQGLKKYQRAPNISKIIDHTNDVRLAIQARPCMHVMQPLTPSVGPRARPQVAAWVATKILESEQIADRVSVLRYFVDVAYKCYELRNFNTVPSIIAALESTPVHRMRKTWDAFARKHRMHMGYVGTQ